MAEMTQQALPMTRIELVDRLRHGDRFLVDVCAALAIALDGHDGEPRMDDDDLDMIAKGLTREEAATIVRVFNFEICVARKHLLQRNIGSLSDIDRQDDSSTRNR